MKAPKQENGEFGTRLIERLVAVRLKARFQTESLPAASVPHPDDDMISAFFEGRLEEAESLSIVSHLVNCATCLDLTASLIRFEADVNEISDACMPEEDPGLLRKFLGRIAEGVTPLDDEAVLAYQEKDASSGDDESEQRDESPTAS
jgi:hypothetical protein